MGGKGLVNTHFLIVKFLLFPQRVSTLSSFSFQFLNKTAFPSKEGLQKRNDEEAHQELDKEMRQKFGLVKGVRVVLNRLSPSELRKLTVKASALKKKGNH